MRIKAKQTFLPLDKVAALENLLIKKFLEKIVC